MEIEKLHNLVEEYCRNWIGEPQEAYYLHEEIGNPSKRTDRFQEFLEYTKEKSAKSLKKNE